MIVGGGPAGLAPLVAASRDGRLDALLAGGLAIVESTADLGAGRLGSYVINSDSTAETFLTAVSGHADPRLGALLDDPLCAAFGRAGRGAVPLTQAGQLSARIGGVLGDVVEASGGAVLTEHDALDAQQRPGGGWVVRVRAGRSGNILHLHTETLLLATGGVQGAEPLGDLRVAGRSLLPRYADRLLASDWVLRPEGLAAVRERLARSSAPRVAIVGGSTSAVAVAGLLLRQCGDQLTAPNSIALLHRRPLRIFYPSREAALAEGYTDFGPDDLCPVSGFVYRLAGFRLDSRDLVMRLLGIGGRPPEPRVASLRIGDHPAARIHAALAAADVIVAATGYQPRALPLRDAAGQPILLRGVLGRGPLVDDACAVCDAGNRPVPDVWAVGLAAGFLPSGSLGGEPSFRGQANGLWLWQTAVGTLLVDHLMAPARVSSRAAIPG